MRERYVLKRACARQTDKKNGERRGCGVLRASGKSGLTGSERATHFFVFVFSKDFA
jgi:hypothetical protein